MGADRHCNTLGYKQWEGRASENTEVPRPGKTNQKNIPSSRSSRLFCGWHTQDSFQESFFLAEYFGDTWHHWAWTGDSTVWNSSCGQKSYVSKLQLGADI